MGVISVNEGSTAPNRRLMLCGVDEGHEFHASLGKRPKVSQPTGSLTQPSDGQLHPRRLTEAPVDSIAKIMDDIADEDGGRRSVL